MKKSDLNIRRLDLTRETIATMRVHSDVRTGMRKESANGSCDSNCSQSTGGGKLTTISL